MIRCQTPGLYRSVVGALQYVTIACLEISYVVNRVCQFMHSPSEVHWDAVKCILRYLKGTLSTGLIIEKAKDSRLVAFSDAGWASDADDCRSQHDFSIYFGGNLISWSIEAEYRAIAFAAAELIWLRQLLLEMTPHLLRSPSSFLLLRQFAFLGVLRLRFAGGEGSSSVRLFSLILSSASVRLFGVLRLRFAGVEGSSSFRLFSLILSSASVRLFVALRLRFAGEGSSSVRGPASSSVPLSSSSIRRILWRKGRL
ncbi:hypothetical protein V2J09_008572 [Rumex salicifolius]